MDFNLIYFTSVTAILSSLMISGISQGFFSRVGPGRALVLALASRARFARIKSARAEDVATLTRMLRNVSHDQVIVVMGKEGIGKSVVIDTATQLSCGVTTIAVRGYWSKGTIVDEALCRVSNRYAHPLPCFHRVLWWYRLFLPPPIVVLRASERMDGGGAQAAFADVPDAACELAAHGLRVLIDGSAGSRVSNDAMHLSKRLVVLELEDMPRKTLYAVPEYAGLFSFLKAERLDDVAWRVLGGVPADYCKLATLGSRGPIVRCLRITVDGAISRRNSLLAAFPGMLPVLAEFKQRASIPESMLGDYKKTSALESNSFVLRLCSVLRVDVVTGMLVPVDAAMALVLTYSLATTPSIEALAALPPAACQYIYNKYP